jgi:YbbR-like protein
LQLTLAFDFQAQDFYPGDQYKIRIERQKHKIRNCRMPFQDSQDLQSHLPRQPGAAERLLRYVFVEDWNLKLLALAITLALWFAVTGQKKPMTKRLAGVQLSFVLGDRMQISNDPPDRVDVTLTGSNDKLAQINPMDLQATVTVADHTTGDRVIRLSGERVKMDLPEGVRIEGFQPATVFVRLEPKVQSPVDVDIKLEGKVAEGYEVIGVSSTPASVRVEGPASHVNKIHKAPTESISLEGRKDSFDLANVAINIADQKIDVLDAVVQVHVDIGERRIERSFGNVRVQAANGAAMRPNIANVVLSGSESALSQLRAEDLRVIVDPSNDRGAGPRLVLPQAIQDKVKLVSIKPSTFSFAK